MSDSQVVNFDEDNYIVLEHPEKGFKIKMQPDEEGMHLHISKNAFDEGPIHILIEGCEDPVIIHKGLRQ